MQGYVLDKREPLYGLADEIIKLPPIPVSYIGQALNAVSYTHLVQEREQRGTDPMGMLLRKLRE